MERNAMVAKTFRNNLGFLSDDLLKITWRRLYTLFLVVMSRLNPLSLLRRDDGVHRPPVPVRASPAS